MSISPAPRPGNQFPDTNWTILLKDVRPDDSTSLRRARLNLCQSYWQPLYHYARAQGKQREDAEDLVQSFLSNLLEKNQFLSADEERGKFRTFLLTSFKRYMIKEREKSQSQKRGGNQSPVSLDVMEAESHISEERSDESAEVIYDIQWAKSVVAHALSLIEQQWSTPARQELFEKLKPFLTLEAENSIAEIARELNRNDSAVRMSLKQLRSEYRATIAEIIRDTLPPEAHPDEEIAYLVSLLLRK